MPPGYGRTAARLGIHAVTAVPLQVPAVRLGVLCCYGTDPAGTRDLVAAAETVAAVLTPIMLRAAPAVLLPALIAARRPAD